MNLLKQLTLFASALVLIFALFTGCSSQSPKDSNLYSQTSENANIITQVTPSSIADYIMTYYDSNQMTSISSEQLTKHYNITDEQNIDFVAYISISDTCADEFAVFQTDQGENHDIILNAVVDRVNQKSVSFRDTNTIESKKIQNSQIIDMDGFVILIINENASDIKDSVTSILTQNK